MVCLFDYWNSFWDMEPNKKTVKKMTTNMNHKNSIKSFYERLTFMAFHSLTFL